MIDQADQPDPTLQNWALLIEYHGGDFIGWQRQAHGAGNSVQGVLEKAASFLNGGAPVASTVAGRTDAGVHAEGQVAQIALPQRYRSDQIRNALNFHLRPHRVSILDAQPVSAEWNARFSAIARHYRYTILNRSARPAIEDGVVWQVERALDEKAMQAGADYLLGRHDFTAFRATACQAKSPIRTLDRLDVSRVGDKIHIIAEARSFLHHQVRNMVGSLALVGSGRWRPSQMKVALESVDRRCAGPTSPPDGLFLTKVVYETALFDRLDVGRSAGPELVYRQNRPPQSE